MIRPEDDRLHRGSTDPYWNESAWFGFTVPERALTGWVYFFHRPTLGYTVGGVALWDPSGEHAWDCLHYDWGDPRPTPEGAEMYDFALDNGLTVRCREPLAAFDLGYAGDGCALELSWDGVAPPQGVGSGDMPAESASWGTGHYNQPGRVRGEVRLGAERLAVDCHYARDHSWGPRRPAASARGSFASAIGSADTGFLSLAAAEADPATDPCVGVPDPVRLGFLLREGTASPLVEAHRTVTERAPDGRPRHVEVRGRDAAGRELDARGTCRNLLRWHGYGFLYLNWCLTDWELDGQVITGEDQDFFPLPQARRLHRRSGYVSGE